MNVVDKIKHAPKWAWFTVLGVGVGGGAIMLYRNRASAQDPTDQTATDATDPSATDAYGTYDGYNGGTVTVPQPVSTSTGVDQGLVGAGSDLFTQALQGSSDTTTLLSGLLTDSNTLNANLLDAMLAGSAPQSTPSTTPTQNPTPSGKVRAIKCHGRFPFYDPDTQLCFRTYTQRVTHKNGDVYVQEVKENVHGRKKVLSEHLIRKHHDKPAKPKKPKGGRPRGGGRGHPRGRGGHPRGNANAGK